MKRRTFIVGAAGFVAASCGPNYRRATDAEVKAAYYRHDGPPQIAVLNMVNTATDISEHTGIMINGSQRILYDPAGNYNPSELTGWDPAPRKYDIHYGFTDHFLNQYRFYHARLGYFVHQQTVNVPLDVANKAIRLSEERGETNYTFCALSASWVLKQLPGFEVVKLTPLPQSIRNNMAKIPGVKNTYVRQNDEGKNYKGEAKLVVGDPEDIAPPPKPEFGRS